MQENKQNIKFPDENENVSIIIPTFHEARNIPALISRIAALDFNSRLFEVIIVDDESQDGSEEIVNHLKDQYHWLRMIVRKEKKGLSESVMTGVAQAKYPILIVMDADLSHPPEKIPAMLRELNQDVDLVIGSRYVAGGSSDAKWSLMRKVISRSSALFTRFLIGLSVNDPLSGFLAFRKKMYYSGSALQPIGWKIGLEIMVKCQCKKIREIPIHFSERKDGKSKLDLMVVWNYVRHVNSLIFYKFLNIGR